MATEAHRSQVFPDPNLGSKKVTYPPYSPKNLPSVPNFIPICPAVWISIENTHPYTQKY